MNLKEITKNYFKCFEEKRIDELSNLYSDEISLQDWELDLKGKKKVLKANASLFELEFSLVVHSICQSQNKTFNEIAISINNNVLKIIDVISFDEKGLICDIKAYKM